MSRETDHPRPSSVEALVYRGCPCRDPPVKQGGIGDKAPTFFAVVVCSGQCLGVRGRDRVFGANATENTHTLARLEALFKLCRHHS